MAAKSEKFPASVVKRAKKIKLFLMDVDGTLTEGGVCLLAVAGAGAAAEMKVFNAHDGAGLTLAHIMGIKTGFISGRNSLAVVQRANEVHADFVYQGQAKKIPAYRECLAKAGVREDEVCYLGDDLPDIPLLERVGLAVAVADATFETKEAAHYVTQARGGRGAAREVVELILKSQGRWKEAVPKALA
jgi:3-deoxy-D-manno-octulosonate 8-phosphate phosphatase (KDO 8-P phosphatase)